MVKETSSKVLHDYIKNQSVNESFFESKKDCGFTPQSSLILCAFSLPNGRVSTLETTYPRNHHPGHLHVKSTSSCILPHLQRPFAQGQTTSLLQWQSLLLI